MSRTDPDIYSRPEDYAELEESELRRRIVARKKELGNKLIILTHHYQRKEIIDYHDLLGDSFALARLAAEQKNARHIVFCGVKFMAEAADILTGDDQAVYLSHPDAGCPMADMAPNDKVLAAWDRISSVIDINTVIPLVYMNSSSEMKAFCGEHNGLVCTSANADLAFKHCFKQGEKLFFFPDQHLGRNTANKLNIPREKVVIYDSHQENGGLSDDDIRRAKVILWCGNCPVHVNFTADDLSQLRLKHPGIKIVVHPECPEEVVYLADSVGSTSHIVKYVEVAPAGSLIAIGTELTMVNRLNAAYPDKHIFGITGHECTVCADMNKTTLADLCFTIENFEAAELVKVPEETSLYAKIALERMLEIGR